GRLDGRSIGVGRLSGGRMGLAVSIAVLEPLRQLPGELVEGVVLHRRQHRWFRVSWRTEGHDVPGRLYRWFRSGFLEGTEIHRRWRWRDCGGGESAVRRRNRVL